MKYIRTKEGIYIQCKLKGYENCYCLPSNTNITKKEDLVIFKQADNLKELCDEFVIKVDNEYLHAKYYHIDRTFYIYNTDEEISLGECLRFNYVVKGAIWTDEGLIYVAKMNSEGELELL